MMTLIQPFSVVTMLRLGMSMLALLFLAACTTGPHVLARDPYEFANRQVFSFNEGLDATVLKPAAQVYDAILPNPLQNAVDNFTNNIKDVWSFTNLILQGEGAAATYELMRIGVNTTLGLAGFVDVATDLRLDRHNEDFGQTLAVWGVNKGPYLVLPVFGPSTVRDAIALPLDQYVMPVKLFHEVRDINAMRAVQVLNTRAKFLAAGDLLNDAALDKYAFIRDAYLQRRRNLIYNGEPPDDEGLDEAGLPSPYGSALFTKRIHIPNRLSDRMHVRINGSVDTQEDDASASWTADVELPTLPKNLAWQTVSTN